MVWPMMTVTVTILRASLGSNFGNNYVEFRNFRSFSSEIHIFVANFSKLQPSKFVTVTVIIGHALLVATPLSTLTLSRAGTHTYTYKYLFYVFQVVKLGFLISSLCKVLEFSVFFWQILKTYMR